MSYDMLKLAVEGLSGGKNTIILDDRGMPSFMVRFPKLKNSELIDGATEDTHPAFIVDGVEKDEILISKYQNIVKDDRAYSLPLMDPKVYVTFDQAKEYCENKGKGWHLMTNAEWAGIAAWCEKNGFIPRGNNNYGQDADAPHEKGVVTYTYTSNGKEYNGRVATGSGPASWAHDGTNSGIFDMNGNIWEWVGGMRLVDGEIQIINNNNAAAHVNQGADSTLWKAIMPDGTLVDPGTSGTLKYDCKTSTPSGARINTQVENRTGGLDWPDEIFENITAAEGVDIPMIMKVLSLAPISADHGGDRLYLRNDGERLPARGGLWFFGRNAGVRALDLGSPRANSYRDRGFRSAFVDK